MAELRIGVSGWRYPEWRGTFYPKTLPQSSELNYLARRFNSLEINGSFYSLQRPESYRKWYDQTGAGFVFAVKGGRFITHMKKLRGVETALANFFASGVLALGAKLGPILWQFPENLPFDSRWEAFFKMLPKSTRAAAHLAAQHDPRLEGRSDTRAHGRRRLRYAVEIRNKSALGRGLGDLARRHGVALVVADSAGRWPRVKEITADFVYVRLHGEAALYRGRYSSQSIARWAREIRGWLGDGSGEASRARGGRDVYVYFDNDAQASAPFDALALARALGIGWQTAQRVR